MRRARRTLAVVAFTLVSCSSQIVPAATPTFNTALLRLYTTTAAIPLANELTTAYSQRYASITFDVTSGNYESMVEQVLADEGAYFISNHLPVESPLWAAPIGQDGVAVVLHPDNPVANLTTEQLRGIYQGRISNWLEVGGHDESIVVISREDGSGTRAEFERLIMGTRRTTRLAQIAPSSAAVVTSVSRAPGGIGYVSMSYLTPAVRAAAIDEVMLTQENVYNNTYPLRSTLFIVGLAEPEDSYRAFIGWVQSPEGQAVVARAYSPLLRP